MVSFWRVEISGFEYSKRLSSTKLPAVFFPSPSWGQPGNSTPCWPEAQTAKVGLEPAHLVHAASLVQETPAVLQQHCGCDTSCACSAPSGLQGKAAADSGAPGPNTSAGKHHPVANKPGSVPLTRGFHLSLCMKRGLGSHAHVHKVSFQAKLLQESVLCIYDVNEQHAPLWPQALEKPVPHSSLCPLIFSSDKIFRNLLTQGPHNIQTSQQNPNSFPQEHKGKFLPPSHKPY